MKKSYFILLFIFFVFSCSVQNKSLYVKSSMSYEKLNSDDWKNWQHKDIKEDSIVGISLDKAYRLLENKSFDTTIVAVLDTRIIKGNKDIDSFLWRNNKEIPNNDKDDDHNEYIDDIHGWNYLGNIDGRQEYEANYEFIRIIRKFEPIFKGKNRNEIKDTANFDSYKKALKIYENEVDIIYQNLSYLDSISNLKRLNEKHVHSVYNNVYIKVSSLDSLAKIEKDSTLLEKINFLKAYKSDEDWYNKRYLREKKHLEVYYNKKYKERSVINDNPNDLNDRNYGNSKVFSDSIEPKHIHSIKVVGVLTANRTNNYGIKGVTNTSKIMMVTVSPSGDERDKDIALGIRYAVDNGAKIINITFTKYFSEYPNWVKDALNYANKNDVLVVCAAGNYSKNLDEEDYFPNDINTNRKEVINNFLIVGSSTPFNSKYLVSDYSNYGKQNVDIFAPGEYIYTTKNIDQFDFASGTSYSAPIVSGIAALIRSYYPNLTAAEVKQIIMESGVSHDIMVNKPSTSKDKELVPFSSLSKSGKVVNAYNALLMAEEFSKKKKK